nr:CMF_HP1_G0042450.mRNA.1.CDS.1 [Saccharomyces cerevisiae]
MSYLRLPSVLYYVCMMHTMMPNQLDAVVIMSGHDSVTKISHILNEPVNEKGNGTKTGSMKTLKLQTSN